MTEQQMGSFFTAQKTQPGVLGQSRGAGWGWGEVQERRDIGILIHVVVWQKPTQYCKAVILQ